jgi:hypothetical protein
MQSGRATLGRQLAAYFLSPSHCIQVSRQPPNDCSDSQPVRCAAPASWLTVTAGKAVVARLVDICYEAVSHALRKTDAVGPSQSDKFKEAARALECDDDDTRFKERVKKLVRHKPWRRSPVSEEEPYPNADNAADAAHVGYALVFSLLKS